MADTLTAPKLLAFDLDGTLLPASKELTPRTHKTLRAMRELGSEITLVTGKFHHLALRYGTELGLTLPQISHDGAIIGGNGHPEIRRGIDQELAEALIQRCEGTATIHGFADDGQDAMLLSNATDSFRRATQNWADDFRYLDHLNGELQGDPAILTFYGEEEDMLKLADECEHDHPELRVSRYRSELLGLRRITFQPKGVHKGTGVLHVAEILGAEPHECWVFGDWLNDLPMFEGKLTSVAMTNAMPELKALAKHETDLTSEEDGVAHFLEQHFLR